MTVAAISLLTVPKSVAADAPATGAVAPEGPAGFAAMMAGVGHLGASRGATTQDTKDIKGGKDAGGARDAKGLKGTKVASDTGDADADQDPLDEVRDTGKDKHDDRAQDDSATSTMALLGLVVPPVVPDDDHGETAEGAQSAGQAGDATAAVSTAIGNRPPLSQDLVGNGKADTLRSAGALSSKESNAAALAPMLAALTDTLAKGAAARRAEAAESGTGKTGVPLPSQGANGQQAVPATGVKAIPLDANDTTSASDNLAQTILSRINGGAVSTEKTAAVSVEKAAAVSTGKADVLPLVSPPLPATATLMAARAATSSADAVNTPARKPAPNAHATSEHDQEADTLADASATPATAAPVAGPLTATGDKIAPASSPAIDGAGQQLAAATTDRQLDLARQGAWLDGIAHDISSAAASTGTVRFEVAPQNLGPVSVELKRDDSGAAVTLTAGSEAARSILTDATPQLLAEARAHGLHIASAQVDVGTGNAGSNSNSSPDSQGRPSGRQPDGGHTASQNSGFSAQTGMGGDTSRQSQTRSQPLPEYRSSPARTESGSVAEAKASAAASSGRSSDARYA